MRKLIMWNIITLDGYFEGEKNWDLSFHELVWGEELEKFSLEQLDRADYLVFGRVTYEGMADYWKTAKGEIADRMNSLPKLVVSKTLETADWNNTTLLRDPGEIKKIKVEGNRDMYVFGSATLSESLIEMDLIDEYRICVAPIFLGKGRPLYRPGQASKKLNLLSVQPLKTGGAILKYSK